MFFNKKSRFHDVTELVKACQQLDRRAQNILYDRYMNKMLGVCRRYARTNLEAEDIFQEAFMKIFQKIDDLKNPLQLDSWIKVIVIRTAINYYQRTTKSEKLQICLDSMDFERESGEHDRIFNQLDMEILINVISELPNGYLAVINLFFIDGHTHAEIANLLGIEESTSKSQLSRGKDLLIKKLQKKGIMAYERL
ncbi:RNA polymerase sigma factor [Dyadobacter aurulentus]|uniref:RNA polymerase sigma factor n=1 Tax=Dyadobacter sp. UC 10 TaxID=2605428 RepID=UPI0011F1F6C6|nr:sigma-70 family RNA polymerase sigma factor [Dyadobacter sp. UC 10]KAA0990153.1 sigma-70 family RNA polymerase sigma factor [Dyadobacter sp. UC 10]